MLLVLVAIGALLVFPQASPGAEEDSPSVVSEIVGLDTVWVLITAFLVFFMQAGFAMLETGLTRAKNACNILMKNFMDFSVASIMFFLVGYALMFGEFNGFIGFSGFGLSSVGDGATNVPIWAFWLFQAAFCGTAATIVSGAMAGRMKFKSYLLFTVVISAVVYPIIGHWVWNTGGWLYKLGFADFAGSTVVHATGGCAGFIGAVLLGPRIGRYNGKTKAIAGHSIPLACIGVFILWFGWFGFNPGSTLGVVGKESLIGLVAANTNLAAAAGAIMAMITVWVLYGKPDLSMTMNGALAGLVAITAPCAFVQPWAAIVIGGVAGVVVVAGVALMDRIRVDDPVGAVAVHGICGLWGTLAVGLFGAPAYGINGLFYGGGFTQLGIQALGTFACAAFAIAAMGIVFLAIKKTVGLRVSRDEELRGLDIGEHGMESYAGFQVFVTE
ncbi:MAG TPA: ammonium transporter [Phycisphaerae bacterium]|nr:ammonium transporter [Phycisphaerae bacterium]HDZ44794.1 ammonium transporter [Phycisphaerae bacterium]